MDAFGRARVSWDKGGRSGDRGRKSWRRDGKRKNTPLPLILTSQRIQGALWPRVLESRKASWQWELEISKSELSSGRMPFLLIFWIYLDAVWLCLFYLFCDMLEQENLTSLERQKIAKNATFIAIWPHHSRERKQRKRNCVERRWHRKKIANNVPM